MLNRGQSPVPECGHPRGYSSYEMEIKIRYTRCSEFHKAPRKRKASLESEKRKHNNVRVGGYHRVAFFFAKQSALSVDYGTSQTRREGHTFTVNAQNSSGVYGS